jgi:hypothetical protein
MFIYARLDLSGGSTFEGPSSSANDVYDLQVVYTPTGYLVDVSGTKVEDGICGFTFTYNTC